MKMLSPWESWGLKAYFLIWSKKKICLELMMMERTISVIKEIWLKKHPFQPREGKRERARGDWFDEGIRSVTTVIKLTTKNIFQYVLLKHIIALISSAFWRFSFIELQKNLLVTQTTPRMPLVSQTDSHAPNSRHWLSQCCCCRAAQTNRAMFW